MKVHIYSSFFESQKDAMKFASERDYDDDKSKPALYIDVEAEWLDEDFVETIFGAGRFNYLESLLANKNDIKNFKSIGSEGHNTLFLIFAEKDTSNANFSPSQGKRSVYLGSPNIRLS